MESKKNNSVTLTQKRIASAKGLHLICAIVAMILNIIAFAVLAVNVTLSEVMFLVFPFALAVLDVLFLVKVIFSNYRFKYAVNSAILHSVIVLAVSVAAYAVMGSLEKQNGTVFVTVSLYAMLIVHVVQSIATLTTALYATKSKKGAAKIFGVFFTVVFLASAGIYGRMLLADGFFGQGGYSDYRAVVYKYNAQSQTYTAVDVLDGYGTDVKIPHRFNGSHVSYIDCALFTHEELTSVEVSWMDKDGCMEKLGFVGIDHLNKLNPELKLLSPQGYMNDFRKALYKLSEQNHYALDLANHVYPSDLKENEVYISFGYDAETLALVGTDNIIPVWVRDKGTAFDVLEHGASLPYVANSDALDPEQLYWCHEFLEEKIFKCVVDAEGNEVAGAINESVVNATVVFEKLYHLEIMADNEAADKTPIKDEHRYMWNGEDRIDYIITTAGNMQLKLDAIPTRKGFTLAWKTGTNKHELASLAEELALLDASGKNTLTLYPEWTLDTPTINTLSAGGSDSGYEAVYGSDALLGGSASHVNDKIALKYEWFYGGAKIAEGNSHTLENIYPAGFEGDHVKAGTYTLRVTAGGDDVTKLTSTAEKTIEISFKKKTLDFTWVLPEGNELIYNAASKNGIIEGTAFNASDVINGDAIGFRILSDGAELNVKGAGTYALKLELTGSTADLYEIKADKVDNSVEIKPLTLDAVWDNSTGFIYVYDGTEKYPACTVTPLDGDVINIEISGKGTNYAKDGYTATVSIDNPNYAVSEATKAQKFTVAKRPVTVTGWNGTTFVYNSKEQYPRVSGVQNLAGYDNLAAIADDIIYDGKQVNVNTAGQYTVSVSLPEVYNYEFTDAVTCLYDITPANITVNIDDKEMMYNGGTYGESNKTGFTFTVTGLQGSDKAEEIFAITYGDAEDAVNWREEGYTITATLNGTGKAKYRNYNVVAIKSGMLTIKKRPVTIKIDPVIKMYDGLPFTANDVSYKITSGELVDDESTVFGLEYSCDIFGKSGYIDGIIYNRGYEIRANVIGDGYINNTNYDIKLVTDTVTMKQRPIKIVANSTGKTYDGTPASENEFTYKVELEENKFYNFASENDKRNFGAPIYSNSEALIEKDADENGYVIDVYFDPGTDTIKNYAVTYVDGVYTIEKRELTVTLGNASMEYNGYKPDQSIFKYKVMNLVDGEDLGIPRYSGEAVSAVNVKNGGYELTIIGFSNTSCAKNYIIDYATIRSTFTITPKPISVTVANKVTTYNGEAYAFGVNDFVINNLEGGNGLAANDTNYDFTYTFFGSNANSGEHKISVVLSGNANYEVKEYVDGTLKVEPKAITIIAGSPTVTYNGTSYMPTSEIFSASVKGDALIGNDKLEDIFNLRFYGEATENAKNYKAGGYTVEVTLDSVKDAEKAKNYEIVGYQSGILTIEKRTIYIKAEDVTKTYDGEIYKNFKAIVDISGGKLNAVDALDTLGKFNFEGEATRAVDVNEEGYNILVRFIPGTDGVADNYNVICDDGNAGKLIINRAKLSVSVNEMLVTYNGKPVDPANVGFIVNSGFMGNDNEDALGTPVYEIYKGGELTYEARDAGDYEIRVSFPENKNYEIELLAGALTIAPMQITVTPTAETRVSDGTKGGNFDYVITTPGGEEMAEGEVARIRTELGTYTFSENVLEAEAAGSYLFEVIFETNNPNYNITSNKGTFVITAPATTGTTATTATAATTGTTATTATAATTGTTATAGTTANTAETTPAQ